MKSWYDIKNKGNGKRPSIAILDEIGLWGISAAQFIADVKALGNPEETDLTIHSPGGNVLDGLAMYNVLEAMTGKIYAKVLGIAASAASFVLMAADHIEMPEDSFLMIHNTHGGAYGKSDDLREMADLMDKLQGSIVNIYQKRTGINAEKLTEMMAAETWMSANEALVLGFADSVTNAIGVAAKADNFDKYFKEMPFDSAKNTAPIIENIRDLEKALRDAGHSKNSAMETIAKLKASIQRDAKNDADSQQLSALSARLARMSIPTSLQKG